MARTSTALALAAMLIGCSGAGGGTGTPGAGGGGGSGGSGGSSSGGTGGAPSFMAVLPCPDQASYTTSGTTIQFGVTGLTYQPACLKVPVGTTVTFSGDFVTHPLTPSSRRGTLTGNPITPSNGLPLPDGGTSEVFTFSTPGFFAYYCAEHSDDSGTLMDGVVWVQ